MLQGGILHMNVAHLHYMNGTKLTTDIIVDFVQKSVCIENYSSFPLELAFGVNLQPSFDDFLRFIQSRCFPQNVDRVRLHLKELGLDSYNPLAIIMKTHGRLANDHMSLEFLEGSINEC